MTTIAVIGPGAIGGTVAAWLAQSSDHSVALCVRTPFDSLHVDTPQGPISAAPTLLSNPSQGGPVDWILACVKAYDAEAAALWLQTLLGPNTRLAVLQNGVEHVSRFAPFAPVDRILPCVVDIPAERTAPGKIVQRATGTILAPEGRDGQAFRGLFDQTCISVSTTPDITTALWKKLCINSAGVVSALTMKPGGVVREPGIADIMRDIVRECIAVGRAEGADLPESMVEFVIDQVKGAPADAINSIYGDRLAGRTTEIDARNGVIVRLGEKHGIPTPVNRIAVALVSAAQ